MELALSLGDPSTPFSFLEKKQSSNRGGSGSGNSGFGSSCMGLGLLLSGRSSGQEKTESRDEEHDGDDGDDEEEEREKQRASSPSPDQHPVQLDLLPFTPVPRPYQIGSQLRFPWTASSENVGCEPGSSEMNRAPAARATSAPEETAEEQSSPNSAGSSFMEFSLASFGRGKRLSSDRGAGEAGTGQLEADRRAERAASRGSDDDENGSTRKKLRLSKEQSAFLEESFKEHHTLNPKQKLALAKQLNLRPRQVEVWFQNRRARTKLKQTEVDCEYLKRCCETLTEENRRLQKELQELRALKTSQPFYMQLPATTLTMCPSCERVATASTAPSAAKATASAADANKPVLPFGGAKAQSTHRVGS